MMTHTHSYFFSPIFSPPDVNRFFETLEQTVGVQSDDGETEATDKSEKVLTLTLMSVPGSARI